MEYLQVTLDLLQSRAMALGQLLSQVGGRKVTRGDAVAIICDLHAWVLQQVDEQAPDVAAELARATRFSRLEAESLFPDVVGWPQRFARELMTALTSPRVRVLAEDGEHVRVVDVHQRYQQLPGKQQESRGRARAKYLATKLGLVHEPGDGYRTAGGEVVGDWRHVLARYDGGPPVPAEGSKSTKKAARVVLAVGNEP